MEIRHLARLHGLQRPSAEGEVVARGGAVELVVPAARGGLSGDDAREALPRRLARVRVVRHAVGFAERVSGNEKRVLVAVGPAKVRDAILLALRRD